MVNASSTVNGNNATINVSEQPGIYFVRINNGAVRIIKNNHFDYYWRRASIMTARLFISYELLRQF